MEGCVFDDVKRRARGTAQASGAEPGKGKMGPPDRGVPEDSKRVGSAPMARRYAAAWRRDLHDSGLPGYLQTAERPGWALIACRIAPEYRVDDCAGLGEYSDGSHIQRSVRAAALQFRLRLPRVGGESKHEGLGRIRSDQGIRNK